MLMRGNAVLPAGLIDAQGCLHKDVELTPLSGREEELLAQTDYPTAGLVTEVLSRCVKRIGTISDVTPTLIRALLVGDRQYLLLMLRQQTFGDRVQASLPCPWPECGSGVDIDFLISSIPITECEDMQPIYILDIDSFAEAEVMGLGVQKSLPIKYRLPNGADQEAVLDGSNQNEAQVLSTLLSRCLLSVGPVEAPTADWVSQLPASVKQQLEQEMESRAPNLELTMEAECPECKRTFIAPFELQDFFFGEIKIGTELLLREVHYLAFHYHWSEHDIMAMPRGRRRQYINVLSDEIEKLNEDIN